MLPSRDLPSTYWTRWSLAPLEKGPCSHPQDVTYLRICWWLQENVRSSVSHPLSLSRAMFRRNSFIEQGMEKISLLQGNPHSLAVSDTVQPKILPSMHISKSLELQTLCQRLEGHTFKWTFSLYWWIIMAYWLNVRDTVLIHPSA